MRESRRAAVFENRPRVVGAAVVDEDDFVRAAFDADRGPGRSRASSSGRTSCSLKTGMPTESLTTFPPPLEIDHRPQPAAEEVRLERNRLERRTEQRAPALDRPGVPAAIEPRHHPRQRFAGRQDEIEDVDRAVRRQQRRQLREDAFGGSNRLRDAESCSRGSCRTSRATTRSALVRSAWTNWPRKPRTRHLEVSLVDVDRRRSRHR